MIVHVPFAFRAAIVPKGKRKSVPTRLMGSTPVELVETSAGEAPLALRWHKGQRAIGTRDQILVDEPPVDYRSFGEPGHLFASVMQSSSLEPTRQVTLEEAVLNVGRGYGSTINPLFAGERFDAAKYRSAAELEAGTRIESSEEEEVARLIHVAAANLVAVDGLLYRKGEGIEPLYVFDVESGIDPATGQHLWTPKFMTKTVGDIPAEDIDVRNHYRADQIVEALARAHSAADVLGFAIGDYDPDDAGTFAQFFPEFCEVFDASALGWRHDQWPALRKRAERLIERSRHLILNAAPETMYAWGRLRDALADDTPPSQACDLVEAYALSLRPRRPDDIHDQRSVEAERREILSEVEAFRMTPEPPRRPAMPAGGPRP